MARPPLQLVVALPGTHPGLRGRQRRRRTVLGHRAEPDDRGPVHLLGGRGLGDRHLLTDQPKPDLVPLRGLKNRFARRASRAWMNHGSRTYPVSPDRAARTVGCCLIDTPISIANADFRAAG